MRIGIDFDNTLAGYDRLFSELAFEKGLIEESTVCSKKEIRDLIWQRPEGRTEWIRLQGLVYGTHMDQAEMIDGAAEFLILCRAQKIPVFIISHKTEFGPLGTGPVNLREAARRWMETQGFFDPDRFGLKPENVFFEVSRTDKIACIQATGCSDFVDDLEEVLTDPAFPVNVRRYLLAGSMTPLPAGPFTAYRRWHDIAHDILEIAAAEREAEA